MLQRKVLLQLLIDQFLLLFCTGTILLLRPQPLDVSLALSELLFDIADSCLQSLIDLIARLRFILHLLLFILCFLKLHLQLTRFLFEFFHLIKSFLQSLLIKGNILLGRLLLCYELGLQLLNLLDQFALSLNHKTLAHLTVNALRLHPRLLHLRWRL